ncbi:unnamed protein product [Soboliphyme baturini]|uniref:GPI-anchored protein pfl2 n=1 Tax=Soboliphyme baturini TaxID=241478 RepID=A0A183IJ59_9BILA|nr:unnamed protein product [Soboliphyme baturini]
MGQTDISARDARIVANHSQPFLCIFQYLVFKSFTFLSAGFLAPRELAQTAYFFATDSLHLSTFCLRYRPAVVACICIHLACSWAKWEPTTFAQCDFDRGSGSPRFGFLGDNRSVDFQSPQCCSPMPWKVPGCAEMETIPMSQEGKPWYSYVDSSLTKKTLEALAHEFACICEKAPERWKLRRLGTRKEPMMTAPLPSSSYILQNRSNDAVVLSSKEEVSKPVKGEQPLHERSGILLSSTNKNLDRLPEGIVKHEPIASTADAASPRKPKSESPNIIDLKCYKERREKELAAASKASADGNEPVTHRKSFIPDISLKSELFTEFGRIDAFDPHSYSHASSHRVPPAHSTSHSSSQQMTVGDISRKRSFTTMVAAASTSTANSVVGSSSSASRPKVRKEESTHFSGGGSGDSNKNTVHRLKLSLKPVLVDSQKNSSPSLKPLLVSQTQASSSHGKIHTSLPTTLSASSHHGASAKHDLPLSSTGTHSQSANSVGAVAADLAKKAIDRSGHSRSGRSSSTSDRHSRPPDGASYSGRSSAIGSSAEKHKVKTSTALPELGRKDSRKSFNFLTFNEEQLKRALSKALSMQKTQSVQPPSTSHPSPLPHPQEGNPTMTGNPLQPPLPPDILLPPPPPPSRSLVEDKRTKKDTERAVCVFLVVASSNSFSIEFAKHMLVGSVLKNTL